MDAIQNIWLFVGLSWLLIITPGPDTLFVLTKGVSGGTKPGIIAAIGITIGILVHTAFAALGLSVILQTSALAFTIVKYAGAGYLLFLGFQATLSKKRMVSTQTREITKTKTFYHALLTNVLNPKVALFFVAFLPQFVHAETGSSFFPFILLGLLFACFTLFFLCALGVVSGYVGSRILSNTSFEKYLQRITGLIYIGLGLRLIFVRQN